MSYPKFCIASPTSNLRCIACNCIVRKKRRECDIYRAYQKLRVAAVLKVREDFKNFKASVVQ